jgi:hypothetical protein
MGHRERIAAVAVLAAAGITAATLALLAALDSGQVTIGSGWTLAVAGLTVIGLLVTLSGLLRGRGPVLAWVALSVFAVDQATKAIGWRWTASPVINAGADGVINQLSPAYIGPFTGAAMDVFSGGLLAAGAWLLLRRPRARAVLIGGALIWAGFASNWADRLGMTVLTAPGVNRGAVDWVGISGQSGNLADLVSEIGCIVVLAGLVLGRVHLQRRALVVVTAGLAVVTVLAGFAMARTDTADTAAACSPTDSRTYGLPAVNLPGGVVSVSWSIGGNFCDGATSKGRAQEVMAVSSQGAVLASGRFVGLTWVNIAGVNAWLLPTTDQGTLLLSEPGLSRSDAKWIQVADHTWLLTSSSAPDDPTTAVRALLAPAS